MKTLNRITNNNGQRLLISLVVITIFLIVGALNNFQMPVTR